MSIRLLAKDLYRFQKEVERLEKTLASAPVGKRIGIETQLRRALAERERLRQALNGQLDR